jgi:hypothetical protein
MCKKKKTSRKKFPYHRYFHENQASLRRISMKNRGKLALRLDEKPWKRQL